MIAYNNNWLDNLIIRDQAAKAVDEATITKEEEAAICNAYAAGFYMPNIFVRVGLFILTIIIASFSFGLFSLLMLSSSLESFGALSVFFGLLSYAVLEMIVRKRHYKSGVDDALMWMSAGLIVGGLNGAAHVSGLANAILIFFIALFFMLRFINMLMSAVAFIALLAIAFFIYVKLGDLAKATMPFILMTMSALVFWWIKKQSVKLQWRHYANCFTMIKVTTLVCFYVAGNYYVIREASIAMFDLGLKEGESIPFGWLFWILTFLIPLIYIFRGIQRKDAVLLRTGLMLVAAIIFTVRYYYHVIPLESAMVMGGIIMIAIAYTLMKYLQLPKFGFTARESSGKFLTDKLQLESLVIAQTFSTPTHTGNDGTTFGGGSGGGGGATGDY